MRYFFAIVLLSVLTCPVRSDDSKNKAADKNPTKNQCNCGAKDNKGDGQYDSFPCQCIKQLYVDYPGPNDLYFCLTEGGPQCGSDETQELFYGSPSHPWPETCSSTETNCETGDYGHGNGLNNGIPGHGCCWDSAIAWQQTKAGLMAAQPKCQKLGWQNPQYHIIPRSVIPDAIGVSGPVTVMAIPITAKYPDENIHYLCIQIDSINANNHDQETHADFDEDGKAGHGRQFTINYKVNGETRMGLVWLK